MLSIGLTGQNERFQQVSFVGLISYVSVYLLVLEFKHLTMIFPGKLTSPRYESTFYSENELFFYKNCKINTLGKALF